MKNRYLWYTYDFVNSIALVGVLYYFGLWVVQDRGMSQWLVSLPVSLATLILLLLMPRVARKVDVNGTHVRHMLLWSFLACIALVILAIGGSGFGPILIFTLYCIFNFCFQAGYVFYSSLLHVVADSAHETKVSGMGQAWGQAGNLVGVLISFFTITTWMLMDNPKLNVFFWLAIIFSIGLTIVSRIKIKREVIQQYVSTEEVSLDKRLWHKLKQYPHIRKFLFAYALYSDAVVTLTLFVALYLKTVVDFSDLQIRISSLILLSATILGGVLVGRHIPPKQEFKIIKILLLVWPVTIVCFAFLKASIGIYLFLIVMGLVMSSIFALSRAYYAKLIPKHQHAEFFSAFVVFERIGAVFGPILWSGVVSIVLASGASEDIAYKSAIIVVGCLTAIGFILISGSQKPSN